MGIVVDEVSFDGQAPGLDRIADKITELCGLPVVVHDSDAEVKSTLYDLHAHLAFACAPEEQLEICSYRPGEVKKLYAELSDGIALPTARFVTGLNEPPGTQTVYLRAFLGHEPTLMAVTILALEALGGRLREPIPDDLRREYGTRITEAELQQRRQKAYQQLKRAAWLQLLLLPITIPLFLLGLVVMVVTMPWRIWKAWQWYDTAVANRDHEELLRSIPDRMEFAPTTPDAFPELDHPTLQQYTVALEALGFVKALDYTVQADVPAASGGFGRLFFHPENHCIAEVNQAFVQSMAPSTMRCMIGSLLAEGWNLSTTDREPSGLIYAWRRPRSLWTVHPRHSPAELLTEHLKLRQEMIDTLHVSVKTRLGPEDYFADERQMMVERKETLRSKRIEVIQSEIDRCERFPKYEWLGDFATVQQSAD